MQNRPEKLLILGVDAALPDLLQRFSGEGALPNLTKLMQRGAFARAITTFPPLTAAAWSAIVTGAGPGTTGVPCLMVHLPGEDLDKWHTSFDRRIQLAETLWEAGARAGKSPVLVNWPVTWPMGLERGVQVAASLNPPFRFFYMPLFDIASSALYSTRHHRCNQVAGRAVVVTPRPASGWKDLPDSKATPLEFSIAVPPTSAQGVVYEVALLDTSGRGYDEIVVARGRDAANTVARLRVGEMSPWITGTFTTDSGAQRGRFRLLLVSLSGDAHDLRIYATAINSAESYTIPKSLTPEIEAVAGPYMEVDDPWAFMDGWIPFEAYIAQLSAHNSWWAEATRYVLDTQQWDMAFSWVGTVDHLQHVLYGGIDPKSRAYDPATAARWMDAIRSTYREVDDGIGRILEAVDLERTLVLVVSDHGFTHLDHFPFIKYCLAKAGLLDYTLDLHTGEMMINWEKTKCFPLEPGHSHIFVNLKGREPHGSVEPEDYGKVQDAIIEALMQLRDPITGDLIVATIVRKEDSAILGVSKGAGYDRIGDVLFAWKPGYLANPFVYPAAVRYRDGTERLIENTEMFEASQLLSNFTGAHLTLPTVRDMHAAMVLAGPGVKHVTLEAPTNVIDIAPTLARLLDIPTPRDAEGRVIEGVLES